MNMIQLLTITMKQFGIDALHAEAYNNRGAVKAEHEQYERAVTDYTEAIRIKPDYADAYRNRALAKNDRGYMQKLLPTMTLRFT